MKPAAKTAIQTVLAALMGAAIATSLALAPQAHGHAEAPLAKEKAKRSSAAIRQFKQLQPCPATGAKSGPCPGYVVDHIEPLCAGGADAPANMQWQTVEAAKAKDKLEHAQCRAKRKGTI